MSSMALRYHATAVDIFHSLPEKTRVEVIDNDLIFLGAARLIHQKLIRRLGNVMDEYVRAHQLGEVIDFQCDVHLDQHNIVQPDLMFISNSNLHNLLDNGMFGVPDMIVEVLSPGNRRLDQVTKKALYKRVGVKEYWIIDPDTRFATGFVNRDGSYVESAQLHGVVQVEMLGREFGF